MPDTSPVVSTATMPPITCLEDFGGDVHAFLEAIHAIFISSMRPNPPLTLWGKRVGIRREPAYDGKWFTFWHVVSEGKIEEERIPNLRRWERVAWPAMLIRGADAGATKVWRETRGADQRILIATDEFDYLVVLSERADHFLLITAYPIEFQHHRDKQQRAWAQKVAGPAR